MNYYRGNFYRDRGDHRGWVVGSFMPKGDARYTTALEAKVSVLKRGEHPRHAAKYQRTAIECSFVLRGKMRGVIDSREVLLEAGDYVCIPPGIASNYPTQILEDVEWITVKAPSAPEDKTAVHTP